MYGRFYANAGIAIRMNGYSCMLGICVIACSVFMPNMLISILSVSCVFRFIEYPLSPTFESDSIFHFGFVGGILHHTLRAGGRFGQIRP